MIFINAPVWLGGLVFWFFILNGFLGPVVATIGVVVAVLAGLAGFANTCFLAWKAKEKE